MKRDPYIDYTHRFFAKWSPFYDLFAWPISFAYTAAARQAVLAPGDLVLDICTGTGNVARRCGDLQGKVTGVDITPEMLSRAQRKLALRGVGLQLMDARQLGFADDSFDAAVLSFALHDMPRAVRLQVLREAARVARSRLVILDYEFPKFPLWRKAALATVALYESNYLRGYARESLLELVGAAGLNGGCSLRKVVPGWIGLAVIDLES
ncbi:MAG: methyltransferase domain-containing protein [Thermoanaerobaculia bacterium]|nr:methyltransferase domain-containing protein [Thermoanaerobaculia bacterium]